MGATVGALVLIEMALTLVGGRVSAGPAPPRAGAGAGGNTKALGSLVYTEYVYPFEIAAVDPAGRDHRSDRAHAPQAQRYASTRNRAIR